MAALKRSSFGTRLLMNFLTYHGIFWNLRPLKNTTSAKFGWKDGVAVERCQNFWLFPSMQCGRDVENRGKASMQ